MKIADLLARIIGKRTSEEMFEAAVEEVKAEAEIVSVELANSRFNAAMKVTAERIAEFSMAGTRAEFRVYFNNDLGYMEYTNVEKTSQILCSWPNCGFSTVGEVYESVLLRERFYAEVDRLMIEYGFTKCTNNFGFEKFFDMTKKD